MSSLKADFIELLERIRYGREFGHASFEPIYYLDSQIAQRGMESQSFLYC
jgi:hypothetical protein